MSNSNPLYYFSPSLSLSLSPSQSTINILNVISSFPAFHKTLLTEAPPKTTPTDIVTVRGLLESLVLINGPMTGMNNNDEAHLCGLRYSICVHVNTC